MSGDKPEIVIRTPTFERKDGVEPADPSEWDRSDWRTLLTLDEEHLREMGMRPWDGDLWLFPFEWYDHIPEGYTVTGILGESRPFIRENESDDKRHGCLSYGVAP